MEETLRKKTTLILILNFKLDFILRIKKYEMIIYKEFPSNTH